LKRTHVTWRDFEESLN